MSGLRSSLNSSASGLGSDDAHAMKPSGRTTAAVADTSPSGLPCDDGEPVVLVGQCCRDLATVGEIDEQRSSVAIQFRRPDPSQSVATTTRTLERAVSYATRR